MGRRRHTPEQIITALREAEVGLANGKTVRPARHLERMSDPITRLNPAPEGRYHLPFPYLLQRVFCCQLLLHLLVD